jgi:MFS family permease
MSTISSPGWGSWGDRTSRSLATPLLWLAVGAVLATVILISADAGGALLLPVAAVGLGSTAVAWNAIGMLAIVRDVAPGISGAASGRVLLGFYVGLLSSPVAFGFVVDRTGSYTVAWVGVGVLFAVGAVVAWRWRSSTPRPAA